jgi:sortase A
MGVGGKAVGIKLLRSVEFALGAVGVVLLGVYAGAALDGFAQSQIAVEEFKAELPAPSAQVEFSVPAADFGGLAHSQIADFSLWSAKRITAFEKSWNSEYVPPIAVLQIPKIHLEVPVFGDTSALTLDRGAGWIAGTAAPGQDGNVGIAGHRDGFFRGLKDLSNGDKIELLTRGGTETFRIDRIEIVTPEDTSILRPTTGRTLTLVTCYPFYYVGSAPQRFVVEARLDSETKTTAFSDVGRQTEIESLKDKFQGGTRQ